MSVESASQPICVDLFCGAGGLSDGLRQAGFNPVLAVDFDPNSLQTYKENHPETQTLEIDIAELEGTRVLEACGGRQLDLLAGGPSCQGYSTHGKRKADDPRNFLFKHFLRIADETQPKWILIENVQGLLTFQKGYFKNLIINELENIGYEARAKVVCAADYGVPQLRRRIFFLANRIGAPINFPEPTHCPHEERSLLPGAKPYVTIGEAIGDLPLLNGELRGEKWKYAARPKGEFQRYARHGNSSLTLHQANSMSEQARSVAKFIKEGQGLRSVPVEHLPGRFKKMRRISTGELRKDCTTLYYRLDRKKPGYTITCFFRNVASGPFMHPMEDRSLSYREAARIMSFQDRYKFVGSSIARQIGNAVPPLLAKAMGAEILKTLCSVDVEATSEELLTV